MADKPVLTPEERRAKREARRVKQRESNIGRAAKMHQARLEARQQAVLSPATAGPVKEQELHIGCSGWFYWHWRGEFYPTDLPTSEWFAHYVKTFRTVELNAPFYSWPTIATVKSWLQQVGRKKFLYTVKVSELITHVKRFKGTKELVRDFGHIADLLGLHMGCLLFQLPPSYTYTLSRLKAILGQLEHGKRNVVEFRHKTWWNETVFAAFRETGTIFCSCSGPRLPDQLIKTSDDIYIRFHGTKRWYRHDYTPEELAIWAHRIRESAAKRVWIYFNNDRDGYALKNASQLMGQLKVRPPRY